MKGNESKKAFISFHLFVRIGTFQSVTGEKNKKIFPCVTPCLKSHKLHFLSRHRAAGSPSWREGSIQRLGKSISLIRIPVKIFHRLSVSSPQGARISGWQPSSRDRLRFSHLLPHCTIDFCIAAI
jgi:hypothetical protein